MKVRIAYTVHVTDEFRQALNFYYGKTGMASREDVKAHYKKDGPQIVDDDVIRYWREALENVT